MKDDLFTRWPQHCKKKIREVSHWLLRRSILLFLIVLHDGVLLLSSKRFQTFFFLSSLEHMELSMRKLRHYLSENATCYKVIMSQKNASFFYDGCLLHWAHETGLNYSNRSHISRSSLACFIGSPMQKKKKKLQATSLFHFGCSAWNSDLDEAIKRYGWATLLTVNCPTSF